MRAILDPMVKRLFSLVIAVAIGTAPVMLGVCQVTCGSKLAHAARADDAHGDARHHHVPATHVSCHEPPALPRLTGTHPCDHDHLVPEPGITALRDSDNMPMPVAASVSGTHEIALAPPLRLVRAARSAPTAGPGVRPSSPLRI